MTTMLILVLMTVARVVVPVGLLLVLGSYFLRPAVRGS